MLINVTIFLSRRSVRKSRHRKREAEGEKKAESHRDTENTRALFITARKKTCQLLEPSSNVNEKIRRRTEACPTGRGPKIFNNTSQKCSKTELSQESDIIYQACRVVRRLPPY